MMILNLGVDNTGKTTLSQKILEIDRDIKYFKPLGPKISKETQLNFMSASISLVEQMGNPNILYERYPMFEEMVYGKVLRGKSNFNWDDKFYQYWSSILRNHSHLIIYNDPGLGHVISTIEERDQMKGVPEHIIELYKEYEQVFYFLCQEGLNVVKHDYKYITSTQNIIDLVREGLNV